MKAPDQRQLEWSGKGPTQSLGVGLKAWNYSVGVNCLGRTSRRLTFEGISRGGLDAVAVSGEVDTNWVKEELPSDPHERRIAVEEATLGTVLLSEHDESSVSFYVSLSIPEESLDELSRPFLAGAGDDNLRLSLQVTHARGSSLTFWKTAWRKEQLNVTGLTVSASSPPTLEQKVGSGALVITRKMIAPMLWLVVILLAVSRACDWLRS